MSPCTPGTNVDIRSARRVPKSENEVDPVDPKKLISRPKAIKHTVLDATRTEPNLKIEPSTTGENLDTKFKKFRRKKLMQDILEYALIEARATGRHLDTKLTKFRCKNSCKMKN